MKYQWPKFFILFCLLNTVQAYAKSKMNIAAASDMKFALEEIISNFEKSNPDSEIGLSVGSSGKFFEQIKSGAPFDLFFSADIEYPKKLKQAGVGSEVVPYATGRIVLWSTKYTPAELVDLKDARFKKIAIANPLHAPYGVRAVEALKKIGIYENIKDRLVLGENISQAAQFVETGAADAGIIALSIVLAPTLKGKGTYKIISEDLHSPLEQGFILLNKDSAIAVKFTNYMKSQEAKLILKKYGFQAPGK